MKHPIRFHRAGRDRVLLTDQWFPAPRGDVFAFFARAENLERITPPFLRFRIASPLPIEIREGALIDYRLTLHGVPLRWRTRIALWEPDRRFIDEQLRGPYTKWVHEHRFESVEGGTRVHDRVVYRALGGRVVDRLIVERDLRSIFTYRRAQLAAILTPERRSSPTLRSAAPPT